MTLGEKIKAERKRIGLTQEQLADKLCVSRQAIQKWESDNGVPSIENLKAISQLFEVSIDSLVADEEAPIQAEQPIETSGIGPQQEEVRQEMKTCPQCGTENFAVANFCKHCGYSFSSEYVALQTPPTETVQTQTVQFEAVQVKPQKSAAKWFKENLKIILPVTVAIIVFIVICALIPTFISLRWGGKLLNGIYYSCENGECDTNESITFKYKTWKMEGVLDSSQVNFSGTYTKTDDEVIFYYQGIELFRGTLNEDLLTLKNLYGETAVLCKKGHKHNFGEWVPVQPIACADGYKTRTCYCGQSEKDVIPATGAHSIGAYKAERKATCTEDGHVGYYRCSFCQKYFSDSRGTKEIESIVIPAKGHVEGEWSVIKEATCGEDGEQSLFCTVCEAELKNAVIEATGLHDWERGACNVCEATHAEYRLSSDGQYYIVSGLSDAAKNCKEIEIFASYQGLPVKEIGEYSFDKCSGLTSVIIPESISAIHQYAFKDCNSLKSIVIPDGVYRIENSTFEGCSSLKSVTIPESVTSIGSYAFSDCKSLQSISIPEGVTSIGSCAFSDCESLQSISIPEGIERIEFGTFQWCRSIKNIKIPDSVRWIEEWAFSMCESLQSIVIPEGVYRIANGTFEWCYNLKSVTIPTSVREIGTNAFASCESLQSIVIPEGVGSIWDKAFAYCHNLKSVSLPNSLQVVHSQAFYSCIALTDITYNGTKAEWDAMTLQSDWDSDTGNYTIHCTDGNIRKEN